MLRAVVDTNVLLSGLLHGRGTYPILTALADRRFVVLTSERLLEELASVLKRPTFHGFSTHPGWHHWRARCWRLRDRCWGLRSGGDELRA